MNKKKFRETKNRTEILKNLSIKFKDIGLFTLWQKDPETSKRTISTEVQFDSLNIKYNFFSVLIREQDLDKITKDTDTYFLLKGYDFAFKTRLISISPTDPRALQFKIPKDIHLIEMRQHPRRALLANEKANIGTIFINKLDGKPLHTVCPVINISLGGISLVVYADTMKQINIEKEVELHPITTFPELRYPTKANIRNIRLFSKKTFMKDEVYAIGLEFILRED